MSFDSFFLFITWLGSLYVLIPASLMIWLWSKATGFSGGKLPLLGLIATTIAVHLLKLLFRRPRPESTELLLPMPGDWSFPSAHSAQAAAFFLCLALVASRTLSPLASMLGIGLCLTLTLAVGWSRVYLRVHYPSDVVAGFILAVVMVTALHLLNRPAPGEIG